MFNPKRKPISVWTQTFDVPSSASISETLNCDVCIIGGGITEVRASAVIVATNSPISDFVKINTKHAPYRTYAIGIEVIKGTVPYALF